MAVRKAVKKTPRRQPLIIKALSLTAETPGVLEHLSQEASDYIGRTVSASAIVRALLIFADRQDESWRRETLYPLIEHEIEAGSAWGKRRREGS